MAVRLRGALAPGVDAAPEVRFAGPWVEAQTLNPKDGTLVEWWENHGKNGGETAWRQEFTWIYHIDLAIVWWNLVEAQTLGG